MDIFILRALFIAAFCGCIIFSALSMRTDFLMGQRLYKLEGKSEERSSLYLGNFLALSKSSFSKNSKKSL